MPRPLSRRQSRDMIKRASNSRRPTVLSRNPKNLNRSAKPAPDEQKGLGRHFNQPRFRAEHPRKILGGGEDRWRRRRPQIP